MTLAVSLSPEAEARLKERASAAGVDATTYAAQLLEQKLTESPLTEISGDSQKRFAESGMSEAELGEQLEREDHASRGVPYDK
jgi:hypothetical protein